MRYFVVIYILITCFNPAFCQRYYTETGITKFDGSRAAFEPIKAMNSKTISLIDLKTAEIAALIYINQFEFRLGLMQEHFNENYLESNNYPKSTFNGKIINFNNDDISEKPVKYEIIGNLEIKGQKKLRITEGTEYIRLSGIIRPEDISTTNTVSSAKIAEAQIEYVGAGILDSATKPGWGSKIFRAISPF